MKINFNHVTSKGAGLITIIHDDIVIILRTKFNNYRAIKQCSKLLDKLLSTKCLTHKQVEQTHDALKAHNTKFLKHEIQYSKDFVFIKAIHALKIANPPLADAYRNRYINDTSFSK